MNDSMLFGPFNLVMTMARFVESANQHACDVTLGSGKLSIGKFENKKNKKKTVIRKRSCAVGTARRKASISNLKLELCWEYSALHFSVWLRWIGISDRGDLLEGSWPTSAEWSPRGAGSAAGPGALILRSHHFWNQWKVMALISYVIQELCWRQRFISFDDFIVADF